MVLVHGTFAPDAEWIKDSSFFSTEIKKYLPRAKVVPFNWSGRNSPSARISSGEKLASLIKSLHTDGHNIWVIGHSHGGNVTLFALKDPMVQKIVNGIVFLGTPFLHITKRPVKEFAQTLTTIASWLLLCPLYIPFGGIVIVDFWIHHWKSTSGLALFLATVIVFPYLIFRKRLCKFVSDGLARGLKRQQEYVYIKFQQPQPQCSTFISQVSWDEAGLILRLMESIAFAPWQIFNLLKRSMPAVLVGSMVFYLGALIYDETLMNLFENNSDLKYLNALIFLWPFVIVISPWIISLYATFVRSLPLAFGFEGLVGAAALRIMPSSRPSWSQASGSRIVSHVPKKTAAGLRHSTFYDDANLIAEIGSWITSVNFSLTEHTTKVSQAEDFKIIQPNEHRWILPVLTGFSVALSFYWATSVAIDNAAIPKLDVMLLPAEQLSGATNLTTIFQLDDIVFSNLKGEKSNYSERPIEKFSNFRISKGQSCLLTGEIKFANWNTSLNLSLHDLARSNSGMDQNVWDWNSGHGATVFFAREVVSRLEDEGNVVMRVWDKDSRPHHIEGKVQISCKSLM